MSQTLPIHPAPGSAPENHTPDTPHALPPARPLAAGKLQPALAALTILGLAGCIGGYLFDPRHFFFSYLTAFFYVLSIVLGMLFFVLLQHLTDAGWSAIVRRPAEHCLTAFPVLALLFLPILAGMHTLFHWAHFDPAHEPEAVAKLMAIKKPFLNTPFFVIRAAIYFSVWYLLSRTLRTWSLKQDIGGRPELSLKARKLSPIGMVLFALTLSFAGIDWLMTLDFEWFSTIFGVYIFAGAAVSALAALSLVILALGRGPLAGLVNDDRRHDLGKLTFAFAVFWAYIAFSQWFLIWYANIPEETGWMLARWEGPWRVLAILMPLGMFVLPFVVLMSAHAKRHPRVLAGVGGVILGAHYIEMLWLVMPTIYRGTYDLTRVWIDLASLALIAGACGWMVVRTMTRHALYPPHDPRLAEALAHDEH